MVLISLSVPGDRPAPLAVRRCPISQATDHSHRCSRNRSFQHSCSSNTWSAWDRVWKGARHFAHRTAMNSRRAAVSCRFSQEVGNGLGREGGRIGGEAGRENRGGGGGRQCLAGETLVEEVSRTKEGMPSRKHE